MAKEIDVLIFFEHENRDLESALMLEYELKKRGLSVACVQVSWTGPIGPLFYKPKVIIANSIYDDITLHQFYDYRGGLEGNQFILINYHCEQMVTNAALEFSLSLGKARDTYHLAWGTFFHDALIESGIDERLVRITGSPRLDFFRESFSGLNSTKNELAEEYGLNPDAKWILAIGNFSSAFLTDAQIQDYTERGEGATKEARELAKDSMRLFLEWIGKVATQIEGENVEIIYRPHPGDQLTPETLALEERHSNCHVIDDRAIREWIVNSDLCLTWTSTSSVEAAVAGKPICSIRPFPVPVDSQIPLLEKMPIVESYVEVMRIVSDFLESGSTGSNAKFMEAISPFYYSFGEKAAVEITADIIEEVLADGSLGRFDSHFDRFYSMRKYVNYYLKIAMKKVGLLRVLPRYELIPRTRTTKRTMNKLRKEIASVFG